ncbi:NADPH-dependent FMN reductase [Geodermatophilus sp. DSM 45219]|uniref:NADPH-dependent FMN reductase n=1 Tax=Geodermatophilus sp. DSM 45219 TaxID=1881103 RepID=UPI000886CB78|nr:NAD(P)H-dependent oxidoreductase [Geodermatophilus sp. DSM 45219]SDN52664.1 NAD(P)H-dependent FMN reductase [Geodermatophilus sp. DSM 45219]
MTALSDREDFLHRPRLHVLVASTRPGRAGPPIAEWVAEHARTFGHFEVDVIDLLEVGLPFLDEPEHPSERRYTQPHTKEWSATVDAADAFVFVTPEYNFGINAALKNALDYLYHEWQYKPVGFVSYGNSSAGLRAVQMTKQVVTTLKMVPVTEGVPIHHVGELVVDGRFTGSEALAGAAGRMFSELLRVANALEPLRVEARAQ